MRLIDGDAFKEAVGKKTALRGFICTLIDKQPTAYDVEKVMAELEHFAKLAEDRWVNGTSNHAYQEHKCWVKAIDIVKRGGIE